MKHLKLFFALFAMLALGVGNAWAETSSQVFDFTSGTTMPAGVVNSGGVAFATTRFCFDTKNDNIVITPTIPTNTTSISIVVKGLMNSTSANAGIIGVYGLSSNGSNVENASGTFTQSRGSVNNASTVDSKTVNETEIKFAAENVAKIKINCDTYSKKYIIRSVTITYETAGGDEGTEETAYSVTLNKPEGGTIKADKDEAVKGATVTLTATPDEGYKFGAWTVTGASGDVAVSNNQFTMPAEDVTVTASFVAKTQYTIKWNVAEGSVADTKVYEGDALNTLPTAPNCSAGKVFIGWTEATSVNADGSDLVLAKETDVPTKNKEYNAVYATLGAAADKIDELDLSLTGASGSTYSSWSEKESVSDAVYAGNSAGGNSSIQLRHDTEKAASGVITTTSGGKATKVAVTWHSSTTNGRTLNVYGNNTPYSTVKDLWDGEANQGTLLGTIVYGTSTELQIEGDYKYIGLRSKSGAMYLSQIDITWSATSASDYSLNCEVNNTPFLTVAETPINFGTVAQNTTATETLNVSGGYLAEDVALTISGTNASFFSVNPTTIAKADEVDQDVTISYNPTATGEHTATLTIKTGDITETVALSGTVLAPGKWALVKNVAELSAGDEIIIASAASNYAIGGAATNNYKGAAITKVGETANTTTDVTILTVEETGVAEAPYAFKTDGKYLYAASSSANQLKAQETNNVNGQWAVTITEGVASIVAAKSSNRKVMQYNPNNGSPIFACYASASSSYEPLAIYRNSENVAKPVISGEVNFVGSTQVTITAKSGLTVYYTTGGSTPDKTATQYNAPFTISATTTVKAIAYDATDNASPVAEMTFTKQELVNVATAMALEKDEIAYFDEFEVVKVVAGKGNIYIKDASGHGLIYDNTLAGELKDGDRVQGFVGISSPYNGLPEAKPVDGLKVADLTITSGVAAEPYDFTSTAIAEADINKYIVFNDVEIATAVSMSNSNKEFSLTINGSNVAFYNQFSIEKTLEAGKTYDIYGFVSIYNEKLQVYFYQALEEDEVVTKYTVTYNAGGATGEVPVDDNEYTEGAQVYLKSATSLTKEGYDYKGWKVTDEGGNEIAVSSNKFNMPASNVTITAQWEEIVVTQRQDFSNGYWVLVTEEGQLVAGDKIVVAAVEKDYAMKSYESGNNIKHLAITKLGDKRFLKWTSEVGVFQLASSGSGYTIQDVNTEEYLYAAGTGDKNYLKATDEVPTDAAAAKPYIWTISYTDGVATVKATSDNHNDLQYNKSADLFSCYASTQGKIALYKHVDNIDPTLVTPTIVENAYFSVGNNKYVQFSTGNLQYEVGTNTWSFAEEQYEVVGDAAYDGTNNTNYGMNVPGYTGKLDLFGWSSDGKFGVNPSNTDAHYGYAGSDFVDWGELVNETGWYTLTQPEMRHILNRTKDGKELWALATVNGLNGLILLPDNWNTNISLVYGYVPTQFVYTENQLTIVQWEELEAEGAVFLPTGGSRTGGYGNKENAGGAGSFADNGDYFHVDNVGVYGYYWLNTQDNRPAYPHCASFLILPGWNEGPTVDEEGIDDLSTPPTIWSREKRRGNSVRLVKEVPAYTVSVTAVNGTVTGAGTYPQGAEVTLTATAADGYKFTNWSNGETTNPYTFTIAADVNLTANFEVATVEPETYTRTVTEDDYGTICLPYASSSFTGAEFYEVSSLVVGQGLWLDQLAAGAQLVAGKPYIFKATDSEITVTYTGEAVAAPVAGANGLTGTFENIVAGGVLVNNYIIAENKVWVAGTGATLPANRAYIANTVPTTPQAQIPGRRRVCMGENQTTGLDNITNGENTTIKLIENGQLIIIRNGEKYNVQGVKF